MTDVSAISGLVSASSGKTSTASSNEALSADMNTFLKLLVTQLQYQDPTDPMDTAEFTNQLVQYSSVEQQIQTNEKLDSMLSQSTSNLAASAVSYIGKVVQTLGDMMPLKDGQAMASYTLDTGVSETKITVLDSSGKSVYQTAGETTSGNHEFVWDGKDSSGKVLEDGAYQIVVSTSAMQGSENANVVTTVFGKVTGIANDDKKVYVGLGDAVTTDLSSILTIREANYFDDKFASASAEA